MTCVFGIPFVLVWRRYLRSKGPIIKKDYTAPELEQKILQIVAKKKGKYISPITLLKKVRYNGNLEEFKSILQRLREEDKVKFDKDDYPYYNVKLF